MQNLRTKLQKMRKNNKGFTLTELIIVIAILGILIAILVPQFLGFVEDSRVSNDKSTAANIEKAISALVADGTLTDNQAVQWDTDNGTVTVGTVSATPTVTNGVVTGNFTADTSVAAGTDTAELRALVGTDAIVAQSTVGLTANMIVWVIDIDANSTVTVTPYLDYSTAW